MGYESVFLALSILVAVATTSLLLTTRKPALARWSWVFLTIAAGGIMVLLLFAAGPVAFWLLANPFQD